MVKNNRMIALFTALFMVVTLAAPAVSAAELPDCHKEHDGSCGYVAEVEAVPCGHVCGWECYESVLTCEITPEEDEKHEHGEKCYELVTYCKIEDEEEAKQHKHDETCWKHQCIHKKHDAECGFVEAVKGVECAHSCDVCNPPEEAEEIESQAEEEPVEEEAPTEEEAPVEEEAAVEEEPAEEVTEDETPTEEEASEEGAPVEEEAAEEMTEDEAPTEEEVAEEMTEDEAPTEEEVAEEMTEDEAPTEEEVAEEMTEDEAPTEEEVAEEMTEDEAPTEEETEEEAVEEAEAPVEETEASAEEVPADDEATPVVTLNDRIFLLVGPEEVEDLSDEERDALKAELDEICNAYYAMTEAEQAEITEFESLIDLYDALGLDMPLPPVKPGIKKPLMMAPMAIPPANTYTLIVPETVTAGSGYSALSGGIKVSGDVDSGKTVTVTAASANSWHLVSGDKKVKYDLRLKDSSTGSDTFEFDSAAVNSATAKEAGVYVAPTNYNNAESGNYSDVITFTASMS